MKGSLWAEIGKRITDQRKRLKLSRKALVEKTHTDLSDKYLFDIEKGNKRVSAEILRNIAIALGVSTDWLLGMPETNGKDVVDLSRNQRAVEKSNWACL